MNYQKVITKNNTLKDAESPIWNVPKGILEDRQKVFEFGMQTDTKSFEDFIEKEVIHQHPRIGQKLTFNGSAKRKLEIAFNLGCQFSEDNYDLIESIKDAKKELQEIDNELESILAGVAHHGARMEMREPYREPQNVAQSNLDELKAQLSEVYKVWIDTNA